VHVELHHRLPPPSTKARKDGHNPDPALGAEVEERKGSGRKEKEGKGG
jgi:hypothetical protein